MQKVTTNYAPIVTSKTAHQHATNLIAFIKANGGMGALALQLNANAMVTVKGKTVFFGGGNMHTAMYPTSGKLGHRGQILWALVNGLTLPTTHVKGQPLPISTAIPTTLKPIALSVIQQAHLNSGSSIFSCVNNALHCNQNAVNAVMVGNFSYKVGNGSMLGNTYATLVPNIG
tara:strand:- start:17 stop:535 length:519 start_codon:yes stop_codon:yes gene_type:complete